VLFYFFSKEAYYDPKSKKRVSLPAYYPLLLTHSTPGFRRPSRLSPEKINQGGDIMRFKILAIVLVCLFVFGCGTPLSKLTNLYPQESDFLYSQMLTTLQELEWTIESTDRPTLFIRAKKLTSGGEKKGAPTIALLSVVSFLAPSRHN